MILRSGAIAEFVNGKKYEIGAIMSAVEPNVRLLLKNGKEINIKDRKLFSVTSKALANIADIESSKALLVEKDEIREKLSEEIDLAELRELLLEEERFYEAEEIAAFLYGEEDYDEIAALLRALLKDNLYFKTKDFTFKPASEEEFKEMSLMLEKQAAAQKAAEELGEALADLKQNHALSDKLQERLPEMKKYALKTENFNISDKLQSALFRAGLGKPDLLFEALISAGVFPPDANIEKLREGIESEFPEDVLISADEELTKSRDFSDRKDLRYLSSWAIDCENTRDRDDAFAIVKDEDKYRLYIHLADPAEFALPGSPLDKEACVRATSIYMADETISMFPDTFVTELAGLAEGRDCPAITLVLELSETFELLSFEIFSSLISLFKACSYSEANSLMDETPELKTASFVASALRQKRKESGSSEFPERPDLEISIKECGTVELSYSNPDGVAEKMIAEFMIWANHLAAKWISERNLPCRYRIQKANEESSVETSQDFSAAALWNFIINSPKTLFSDKPGLHASIGLDPYTQFTSPLRKYSNLLLHRQVKAYLKDGLPAYEQNEFEHLMTLSGISERRAIQVAKSRETYWILKYLEQQLEKDKNFVLHGEVVQIGAEVMFYSPELCSFRKAPKPNFDVSVGDHILVKPRNIDLYEGNVKFKLVER